MANIGERRSIWKKTKGLEAWCKDQYCENKKLTSTELMVRIWDEWGMAFTQDAVKAKVKQEGWRTGKPKPVTKKKMGATVYINTPEYKELLRINSEISKLPMLGNSLAVMES